MVLTRSATAAGLNEDAGLNANATPSSKRVKAARPRGKAATARKPAKAKSPPKLKAKRTRKAKTVEPEPLPEDFPPRVQTPWKVGAHVSAAGGVQNAVVNAAKLGAGAFALFLKSQRKWDAPPLKEESVTAFRRRLDAFGYAPGHVLPHGSYLMNLGNPDAEKREKSYRCFIDELKRCEQLGLELYNFHPGSSVGSCTLEESIAFIAECINRAHKETKSVVVVLEDMTGAGNMVGGKFEDLAGIIDKVEDKSRTRAHLFAAGYDIRTEEGWNSTMDEFESIIGLKYLRAMHLNDSMTDLGSKTERHENLGLGTMSLQTFAHITSDPRTQNIPLVLETPAYGSGAVWEAEIAALHMLATESDQAAAITKGTSMVKAAVKESLRPGKKKAATKRKTKKGKKAAESEDEDEDEDENDSDEG